MWHYCHRKDNNELTTELHRSENDETTLSDKMSIALKKHKTKNCKEKRHNNDVMVSRTDATTILLSPTSGGQRRRGDADGRHSRRWYYKTGREEEEVGRARRNDENGRATTDARGCRGERGGRAGDQRTKGAALREERAMCRDNGTTGERTGDERGGRGEQGSIYKCKGGNSRIRQNCLGIT